LFGVINTYADLFKNESLARLEPTNEVVMQRVHYFKERGMLEVSEDQLTVRLAKTDDASTLLDFFSGLILPLMDTYLITLAAIEQLCGKNLVMKQKTLVRELHVGIKFLYSQGDIPMLHSCIKETISTALARFAELGLLETTSYLTKKGSSTVFLRCTLESRPRIRGLLQRLTKDRAFSQQH